MSTRSSILLGESSSTRGQFKMRKYPDVINHEFQECVPEQIWGEWNNWSYCNVFTGKRSRSAACVGGRPHCIDDLYESEVSLIVIIQAMLQRFILNLTC